MQLKNAFKQGELSGYKIPKYNRDEMVKRTIAAPQWVHFGAGNIFRSFLAAASDVLLEKNAFETGIILFEAFDTQLIDRAYTPYDNISVNVTLCADASVEKSIIGSVAKATYDYIDMQAAFAAESLMLASLTITEKGYIITDTNGSLLQRVISDIKNINNCPQNLMVKLTALLYHRFKTCAKPVALVSMDNFFHNGDKLRAAVEQIAILAIKQSILPKEFMEYLAKKVTFPCSMIDKITPRPDEHIAQQLIAEGIQDVEIFVTDKNTYAACFVNAEKPEYLVIEDNFKNGRPPLEQAGIYLTSRATVDSAEKMKVCACLNPLHTALAVFGCLLNYTKISDEMADKMLCKLVSTLAYSEGLPVCANPQVIQPEAFLRQVLESRLPNPFMPDTPQRIACDTSQKMAVRFGETIKNHTPQSRASLVAVPLVIAGWIRYLTGLDDAGEQMPLSPDPALPRLTSLVEKYKQSKDITILNKILCDESLFGVDLVKEGFSDIIEEMLVKMMAGKGSVREALEHYLN